MTVPKSTAIVFTGLALALGGLNVAAAQEAAAGNQNGTSTQNQAPQRQGTPESGSAQGGGQAAQQGAVRRLGPGDGTGGGCVSGHH